MGHGGEHSAGKVRQSLTGLHEIQIMFWNDTKHPERLIKHLSMLSGSKKDGIKRIRFPQSEINRRHFYGLRPSARNNRDDSFQTKYPVLQGVLTTAKYSQRVYHLQRI